MPRPPKPPPEPGTRFGRWTVVGGIQIRTHGTKSHRFTKVICDCGGTNWVAISRLNGGYTKSCGCRVKEAHSRMLKRFAPMPRTFE